jgi:raffinose/stachyose/melibiose transport system substrate-binding protein
MNRPEIQEASMTSSANLSRHARSTAAIAGILILVAACGGSNPTSSTPGASASAVATATAGAAGSPSGAAPTTAASGAVSDRQPNCQNVPSGPVALTYWDDATENLSDAGVATLDAVFTAKYPNVTLTRVAKTFNDILSTEKLQASGPKPPDILISNGGYGLLGPLVAAGLLKPLDPYATTYGWLDRFPEGILRQQRFSDDGKTYGVGSLWTLAPTATYVGLFVSKPNLAKLGLQAPTTFAEFEASLAAAKTAGLVPLVQGVQEGWPAIHMFTTFQNLQVPNDELNSLVYHTNPASFDTLENVTAAAIAQDYGKKGYFGEGYLGKTAQAAIDEFNAGKALYFLQGTYFSAPIVEALGDDVEMILVPGTAGGPFSVTGGPGTAFGISSKSANPDVAACYIDWRTGQYASELYVAEGGLPAMNFEYKGSSAFTKSVFDAWANASEPKDAIVPYIDFAATNLIDFMSSEAQQLVGGQVTPQQFASDVQGQYEQFKP